MYKRILVLCPHPDDFDVAGCTLRHFHQIGCKIHVAVAPTSSGILDAFYDEPADELKRILTREQEQRESLAFFGLDASAYQFFSTDFDLDSNGEMTASKANSAAIESVILQQKPQVIFIPHPNDSNDAHSAMAACVQEILARHCGVALPESVKVFQQVDPKTEAAEVNAFFPLTKNDCAWKSELLAHHQTQDHRNQTTRQISLATRILDSNAQSASKLALDYSHMEAFEIITHGA